MSKHIILFGLIMMPKVHCHCQAGVRCGSSSCRDQYGGHLVVASPSLGSVFPAPVPPSHTMNHLMEDLASLATRRPRTRRGQPQPGQAQQEEGRGGPVRGRRSRLQHSSTPHHHEVGVAAGRYRDRYTSGLRLLTEANSKGFYYNELDS